MNNEHPSGELRMNGTEIRIIHEGGITRISNIDYPTPIVANYRIEANHTILNAAPIFDHLIIDPGVELSIDSNIAGIEFNTILADGSGANRVTIKSMDSGEVASLIKSSGTVEINNADLQDIDATGGATYNAYGSRNLGNVTGVNFIKFDQEISFDPIDDVALDLGTMVLDASSSSNLPVAFEIQGPAEVDGRMLDLTDVGTVVVTALQVGNEFYNPAESVMHSFEVFEVLGLSETTEIQVFPNPVRQKLTINATQEVLVTLLDLNGRLLYSTNASSADIDFTRYPEGTFILKIDSGIESISKRILKY